MTNIVTYQPTGLPNIGNTCYLNAVLQCILKCHDLYNILTYNGFDNNNIVSSLATLAPNSIGEIKDMLSALDPFFNTSVQQDAHEALIKLLNIIHKSTSFNPLGDISFSQPNSQLFTSNIKENFYGSFHSKFVCCTCLLETQFTEDFVDLVIDCCGEVKNGLISLLKDEVDRFCNNCNTNTKHHIIKKIWQQPNICILRMNRFKQLRSGRVHKDSSTILCNDKLDIPDFKAKLISVIFHKGVTKDSGHYISVIRSAEKWYECNDHKIRSIDFTEFCCSKEVYILFYHKLD